MSARAAPTTGTVLPVDRRLVVVGASMPMTLGFAAPDVPGEGPAYPIALERSLRARGVAVRAIVRSRIGHLSGGALTRFEDDILVHGPDLVILHYGGADALPGAMPRPVRLWVYDHFPSQAPTARWVRRRSLRRVRHIVRAIEVRHGRARGLRAGRRSATRVGHEIELLLDSIRNLAGNPPVLVIGSLPAGPAWESAMPGYNARLIAINAVLERLVSARDERVVYVDLTAELEGRNWVSVDGLHLSDAGHAAVAEVLEPIVLRLLAKRAQAGDWSAPDQ